MDAGPLTDFDLFMARGWRVAASRQGRACMETTWQARQRTALDANLQHMGLEKLTGD